MTDIRVSGASLHIERIGTSNESVVIVIHGGPGEAHDYLRPHFDCLVSDRRSVIYYDQRGTGKSPLDPEATPGEWQTHVRDLDAVCDHITKERVVLVGFSWGALLGLLYSLEHPERVRQLVLVSPIALHAEGLAIVGKNLRQSSKRPEMITVRERVLRKYPDNENYRSFLLNVASCLFDPTVALSLQPVMTNSDVGRVAMQSLGAYDVRSRLGSLCSIATAIFYGEQDPVSASSAQATASLLGATCISFSSCGHAPFIEVRDEFFARLVSVLDDAQAMKR